MRYIDSLKFTPVELGFGTSGLRGLVTDMTDVECYINICGFLTFLKQQDGLQNGEIIYIAGDLRDSTPRIMAVVEKAITDAGCVTINGGLIPTPALAYYARKQNAACIMVTGSHIPSDRNGIKFYKRTGEILKGDEAAIHENVAIARKAVYEQTLNTSSFDEVGATKDPRAVSTAVSEMSQAFIDRYTTILPADSLSGKQIIMYQHSAVGRDLIVAILQALGAKVIAIERSETFVPIDTENVGKAEQALFKDFSTRYPDAFAIVSTDGDSDRPFVIDETGLFHRGDVLGLVVTKFLNSNFAVTPISSNDAVDTYCQQESIAMVHTKIGSPYVIEAMQDSAQDAKPVGWEVNGGFLTGADFEINGNILTALPTRDATLPIIAALIVASRLNTTVSELFNKLPNRATGGGLIDVSDQQINSFKDVAKDSSLISDVARRLFRDTDLGEINQINTIDGLRLIFQSGNVLHLRPSGNAPQFRVYTNTDSQQSADDLVDQAVRSGGYIEQLLQAVAQA